MNTSRILVIILAAAAILFGPAHGSTLRAAEVSVGYFISRPPFSESKKQASGPAELGASFSDQNGSGRLATSANYALLSGDGNTAAVANGDGGGVSAANSSAHWRENITISAPGLAGTQGTVTFRYRIDGNITADGWKESGDNRTYAEITRYIHFRGSDNTGVTWGLYLDNTAGPTYAGTNFLDRTHTYTGTFTFGEPFLIGMGLDVGSSSYNFRGGTASANATVTFQGVISVQDSSGKEVAQYTLNSETGTNYKSADTPGLWAAGRDLARNEAPDKPEETSPTNATVPQWSYGYRAAAELTSLNLFASSDHQNGILNPAIHGWQQNDLIVAANTSGQPVDIDNPSGGLNPIHREQMVMLPRSDNMVVARWTAPEKGTYNIAARWTDLDPSGGNGAVAHVVKNGKEVAGAPAPFQAGTEPALTGFHWPNGGRADMPPRSFRFEAGEVIDFVVGSAGDATADLTAFTAAIRRAPDVTIAAPASVQAGQDVVVAVTGENTDPLTGVTLTVNGESAGTQTAPPFQFVLPGLSPGIYQLEAEGVGASTIRGASSVIRLTVTDAPAAATAERPGGDKGDTVSSAAATAAGSTYETITSGFWSEPRIWRRTSDGANGVPGPHDVAIIGRDVLITLTGNVTVAKVFCDGRIAGDSGNTRELTVTEHFSILGLVSDLTLNIPAGGLFTNVRSARGAAFLENAKVNNLGRMVLTQSLFATSSDITSRGDLNVLTPPASGGPVTFAARDIVLAGRTRLEPGTQVSGHILSQNGVNLIGNDAGSLIGNDGGSLIGNDGGSLIGNDGGSLIGNDGGSLIGNDGGSLIGNDGGSLGFVASGSLVANAAVGSSAVRAYSASTAQAAATAGVVTLESGATVSGTINIVGTLVNRSGFVSPGSSAGMINVTGDYRQEQQATLLLEIGGATANPPQFDQLRIGGVATLGGKLIAKTINGYTPQAGESLPVLSYDAVSGSFASISSNAQVNFGPDGMTMQVSGPNPPAPKALNIATRMRVEAGDNALIAGFIVTGDAPKKVLVRGIGPSLPVSGALADPILNLDNGAVVNDDWKSSQEQEIRDTTIPPTSNLEAAIVATLSPGPHTAILRGKNNGTGVGLVEVYDLESGTPVQLANISTRGQVQAGDNVMIGGFIIGGDYPAKVLLRAIGPSLSVTGKLEDPTLELVDANGGRISNDDWRATQEAEILATTVPPTNDKEAAIVATLVPGFYTAIVRGKDDTAGVALVEGYNLQ